VLLLALLLAAAFPGTAQARSFALEDYFQPSHGGFYASELIPASPVSGRRIAGRALRLPDAVRGPVLSPDRRVVAFGGKNFGEVVRVDLAHMRLLAPVKVGGNAVDVLAWPSPDRMLVLTGPQESKWPAPKTLRVVDPVAGRVLASRPLGVVVATSTSAAGEAVVVATKPTHVGEDSIGPAHVAIAAPDGAIRELVLAHVTAGFDTLATRMPGLAVDFAAQRAWVIGGGESVAEVDLATGAVQDRPALAASTAPAKPPHGTGTQNATEGPRRMAQWLGDGLVAVSGYDGAIVDYDQADTPAGLRILDTRTWTERVIDPNADSFTLAGGTLLTGRNGYGSDGRRRFRLPTSNWWVQQGRLYVFANRHHTQLRDPATGATLRTFRKGWNLLSLFDV